MRDRQLTSVPSTVCHDPRSLHLHGCAVNVGTVKSQRCCECSTLLKGPRFGVWPEARCKPRCGSRAAPKEEETFVAALPARSHKRRAQSDPGELAPRWLPRLRTRSPTLTHRVTPSHSTPAEKKHKAACRDEEIMRMLEETVARREAWEAAALVAPAGGIAHSDDVSAHL